MSKHFLYLTNDKLTALIWRSGAVVERETFSSLDADSPEFSRWLHRHARLPAWLVTDLIEEDFRIDTLPHVGGSDREALIERRLAQLYRASSYRHAIIQGREETGRRDDRVLFHAVTNPDILDPFVNALARAEVPLQGISSSAVLSAALPEALGVFYTHTLLVTIVPDFGLRQTYFRDKQIKFSRLTPIIYDEGKSVGELIAAEASRTWQYLDSLRHFADSDESLEVCIVVHARDRDTIAEAIQAYPLFKYHFLDIVEVAERLKLRPPPSSSHAEEVLVQLFAQKGAENHFAGREQRRFATYRATRFALYAATAAVLALGVGVTGFNLHQASLIARETDRRDLGSRGAQAEYQQISNLIRGQMTATASMRDTSLFYRAQANPATPAPGSMLRELAQAWADFPALRIDQIAWQVHHDGNIAPALRTPPARPLNVRSDGAQGGAPAAGAAASTAPFALTEADPPLAGTRFEVMVIEGAVTGFSGNYRAANDMVVKLLARLNQDGGRKAEALQWPVNPAAALTLRGTAGEPDASEARFTIRLVRQRGAAQ